MVAENKLRSKFQGLLDVGYQESVIALLRDWSNCLDSEYMESEAKTVELELIEPLWWWIAEQGKQNLRRTDVVAAVALAECAASDITYGFRYRQKIYPEHVSKLDHLWKELQRQIGWGAIFETDRRKTEVAKRNTVAARSPRKKTVTKAALIEYKKKFEYKNGGERGWKKAAALEFSIDVKTVSSRLLEE